jgi:hypothetical protein
MHIVRDGAADLPTIIESVAGMDGRELAELQMALDRRRAELKESGVVERRGYRNGVLQLETRAYRRKDGGLTKRGPYWYFHYREGGRQRTKYLGQTDNPESRVEELMKGE